MTRSSFVGVLALCAVFCTERALGQCGDVEPVRGERVALALVYPFFERPIQLLAPPGDFERLFVVQQRGLVRILDLTTDRVASTPFLSLASRVGQAGEQQGLLGMAFHPSYNLTGEFFVHYTLGTNGDSIVSRFRVSADPDRADATSEEILLAVDQPRPAINGGALAFDRDDHLLIGIGDGTSSATRDAQNPFSLLGKILRIDINAKEAGLPYAIPLGNPFADGAAARAEIWALGVHNPTQFFVDAVTQDLYITDQGRSWREELNVHSGGANPGFNFQWPRYEGLREVDGGVVISLGMPTRPAYDYSHNNGTCSGRIVGGAVYRGCAMPDLLGTYFFADRCQNTMRSIRVADGQASDARDRTAELNVHFAGNPVRDVSAIGSDQIGDIYFADMSGKLYRLVPRTANLPPTARIATDPSSANLLIDGDPVSIVLDGNDSDDGDGGIQALTYTWSKIDGPDGGDVVAAPNAVVTEVVFSAAGSYRYRLTVDDGEATNSADVTVLVVPSSSTDFRRGDSNLDGSVDISDGVFTLQFLFVGAHAECRDAADSNDSGDLDLTDAVFVFNFLFLGGLSPAPPGPETCGPDQTADVLEACNAGSSCL